jgi:crotonobetainyl-CoA:carnitine CoA-transferase CaiB-like acyl-CoA transferase
MQPLSDIRVLDLTRILAGPYCTMMLADLGAEVIKVEQPGRGDDSRQWGPPFVGGESAYYLSINRNKKGITLNLQDARARNIVRELVKQSDVLVENFKRGSMDEWGLSYEALRAINPRLVYCNISGYGNDGPRGGDPGYDFVIQAEGGLMSLTGEVNGQPMRYAVAIVDITTGMFAATSIIAALRVRELTGVGQRVDCSLLETQIALLANLGEYTLVTGKAPQRYGNAHSTVVPYQVFKTQDDYFALACGNDGQFRKVCQVMGRMDVADDARYATNPARVTNRETLIPLLEAEFVKRPVADWLMELAKVGVPAGRINTLDRVLNDAQVLHRKMVVEAPHPTIGRLKLLGVPYKLSDTPAQVESAPPLLGQHTDEVLSQWLGYTTEELMTLREAKVI